MEKKNISEILKTNAYPGRGIVIGKSADGKKAVTACSITSFGTNVRILSRFMHGL